MANLFTWHPATHLMLGFEPRKGGPKKIAHRNFADLLAAFFGRWPRFSCRTPPSEISASRLFPTFSTDILVPRRHILKILQDPPGQGPSTGQAWPKSGRGNSPTKEDRPQKIKEVSNCFAHRPNGISLRITSLPCKNSSWASSL